MQTQNRKEWVNWSESLRFTPDVIAEPENEAELCELVRQAADELCRIYRGCATFPRTGRSGPVRSRI